MDKCLRYLADALVCDDDDVLIHDTYCCSLVYKKE